MAPRIDTARDEGGFSLVEVLIAVAILGIVALGIVGLFSHSIVVNASGYDYAVLSAVARQSLEQLQALPFGDGTLTAGDHTLPDPTGSGQFTVSYRVTDYRVSQWSDVSGAPPPDPSTWPIPTGINPANLKRITLGVAAVGGDAMGRGRRQFVVSALKAP